MSGDRDRYGEGRFIDPDVGMLAGEASDQRVPKDRAGAEGSAPVDVFGEAPSRDGDRRADPTYFERPAIKQPTWVWAVPAYFFSGGLAGAAATLGAVAQVADRDDLHGLIKRCRWTAAVGAAAGTALLVEDLGRPERFLNMLRVFRPSSPMNVGSWVLAGAGPSAVGSALLAEARGALGALGDGAGLASGALGLPMSGYTAVLVSNTAVPVWQATRRTLPYLFVSSAASSAASLLELMDLTEREEKIVRRFGVLSKASELAATSAVRRDADIVERVGRPLHQGLSGALWRAARALTAASLFLSILPVKSKRKRWASGLLGTAGAVALRFAVFHAGKRSAADPRATFHQQRAGHGAAEVTDMAAVVGAGDERAIS